MPQMYKHIYNLSTDIIILMHNTKLLKPTGQCITYFTGLDNSTIILNINNLLSATILNSRYIDIDIPIVSLILLEIS